MSAFDIPHEHACPTCSRPALELDGELYCANPNRGRYGEVI